jgi:hypothetical protein
MVDKPNGVVIPFSSLTKNKGFISKNRIDKKEIAMFIQPNYNRNVPDLQTLKSDPNIQEILKQVSLPTEEELLEDGRKMAEEYYRKQRIKEATRQHNLNYFQRVAKAIFNL